MISLLFILLHLHPLHVSVCEANFNSNQKIFEFSQRIFLDDLELTLNKENNSSLDLTHPKDKMQLDSIIKKYIFQRVRFGIDNKKINLHYIGHEVEEGVYWIYFETPPVKNEINEIEFTNTVLFDYYDDQSTIIQIKIGDKTRSYRLIGDHKEEKVPFNPQN